MAGRDIPIDPLIHWSTFLLRWVKKDWHIEFVGIVHDHDLCETGGIQWYSSLCKNLMFWCFPIDTVLAGWHVITILSISQTSYVLYGITHQDVWLKNLIVLLHWPENSYLLAEIMPFGDGFPLLTIQPSIMWCHSEVTSDYNSFRSYVFFFI